MATFQVKLILAYREQQALVPNIRLTEKKISRDKHSSLFCPTVCGKEKVCKSMLLKNSLFMLVQNKLECLTKEY